MENNVYARAARLLQREALRRAAAELQIDYVSSLELTERRIVAEVTAEALLRKQQNDCNG